MVCFGFLFLLQFLDNFMFLIIPMLQEFLGSGADFPVGNVSFFLFFSGHVAGAVIASLDMRRARRQKMAWVFDTLNLLQSIRLLASRGHYTIDLAVGVGAGFVADVLAGKYEEIMWKRDRQRPCCSCSNPWHACSVMISSRLDVSLLYWVKVITLFIHWFGFFD